jgi:hypothetical protein
MQRWTGDLSLWVVPLEFGFLQHGDAQDGPVHRVELLRRANQFSGILESSLVFLCAQAVLHRDADIQGH